ncbi:MAG: hypothetical protein ABII89_05435, partial [Candidatus Omnitrophota bacterium]
ADVTMPTRPTSADATIIPIHPLFTLSSIYPSKKCFSLIPCFIYLHFTKNARMPRPVDGDEW